MPVDKGKKPRHAVYLTDTIWGRLKDRAIIESRSMPTTASDIIEYLLESSLGELDQIAGRLGRYQPRKGDDSVEVRQTRTVYIRDAVWAPVEAKSKQLRFSISGLIESLLIDYLGLGQPRTRRAEPKPGEPSQAKRPSEAGGPVTFLLGDDPFVIDPRQDPRK